ncbi:hypothetical protein ACFLWN_00595 [Chloroflexota bacterium]
MGREMEKEINEILEAEKLINKYCNTVGSYIETGDTKKFIYNFAINLKGNVIGFGGRTYQPLKTALLLVAHEQFSSALPSDRSDFDHIRAGGAALSAMYLIARLENLFRIKSRYLSEHGTLKKELPAQLKNQLQKEFRIKNIRPNWKCMRINQAFHIFYIVTGLCWVSD